MISSDSPTTDLTLEVLEAVTIRIVVFWDVTPCSTVDKYQRFAARCCRHFDHVDGDSTFLRNVDTYGRGIFLRNVDWLLLDYTALYPRIEDSCFIYLFICGLINGSTSSSEPLTSNDRTINEWWIIKDLQGSRRGLIRCTIPIYACRNCGKPRNTSDKITSHRAKIWIEDLRHIKLFTRPRRGSDVSVCCTPTARCWNVCRFGLMPVLVPCEHQVSNNAVLVYLCV
jgi:hypothetical protein